MPDPQFHVSRRIFLGGAAAAIATVAVPYLQRTRANAAVAESTEAATAPAASGYAGIVGVL